MNIELAPPSDCKMLLRDAILYCLTLNYNGHKDWRLMTPKEMGYITMVKMLNYHHGTWTDPTGVIDSDDIDNSLFHRYVKARVVPVRDVND